MKKTSTSLIVMTVLSLVLGACSDSDSGSGKKKSNNDFAQSYQISENGCDTGEHVFTGSSETEVMNKLCEALQDDELNNWCARDARYDYFDKYCQSYSWNTDY